ARHGSAASLDCRRRRDGTQFLVPSAVASASGVLPAGRAVQHAGARPGGGATAVERSGTPSEGALRAGTPLVCGLACAFLGDRRGACRRERTAGGAAGPWSGAGTH